MEPLTAGAIVHLGFQKFFETGAGELGKKFTSDVIALMDELRGKIWDKLRGNPRKEQVLTAVEGGSAEELKRLAVYLQDAMEDDRDFSAQVNAIAMEIEAGKKHKNTELNKNFTQIGKYNSIIEKAKVVKIGEKTTKD